MSPFILILAILTGFLCAVLTNLCADYLPARRLHHLAKRSPFVSESAVPELPHFFPKAPIYAWSGWGAWFTGRGAFSSPRWGRRLALEVGLALAFAWITITYLEQPRLIFLLIYAPFLVLIAVIDIERRWVLDNVLGAMLIVIGVEVVILYREGLPVILRGGLNGFLIMFGLWVVGIIFGEGLGALRGKGVGRTVLGFGDVRLVGVCGLLLGWPGIGFALLIMVFTAALGAISVVIQQTRKRRKFRPFSAIPYAPYIVLGVAVQLYLPLLVGAALAWYGVR